MLSVGDAAVVIRLRGGVGNQLFEWAAARAIAARNQVPLWLDTHTGFIGDRFERVFSLEWFRITAPVLSANAAWRIWNTHGRGARAFSILERVIRRATGRNYWRSIKRMRVSGVRMLDGYFQSPLYFDDAEETIRSELQFRTPIEGDGVLRRHIVDCESIAVHVRREHELTAASLRTGEGTDEACGLPPRYYHDAICELSTNVRNGHIFVFGDRPRWFLKHCQCDLPTTVVQTGSDRCDLWLMSQCRHHVISNSSFAWWGAWMQRGPQHMVVAPERFSANLRWKYKQVYPPSWTVMPLRPK